MGCSFSWVFKYQRIVIFPQCTRASPCYERDKCQNLVPGYQCNACPDGYRGTAPSGVGLEDAQNSKQVCEEIDECKEGISSCDPNSQCINTNVSRVYTDIIVYLCDQNISSFIKKGKKRNYNAFYKLSLIFEDKTEKRKIRLLIAVDENQEF